MEQASLESQARTTSTGGLVASFLHPGDPDVGGRVALATKSGDGWEELTYQELGWRSGQVRAWLSANGIGAGDRVGLLGESGNDWVAAFFGVLRRGAIALPLDTRLTADELAQIWARSAPAALVVSRRLRDAAAAMLAGLGLSPPVLLLDGIATGGDPEADGGAGGGDTSGPAAPVLGDTSGPAAPVLGDTSGPAAPVLGDTSGPAAPVLGDTDATGSTDQPAIVVWTSGTTGTAKGVVLRFGNLDYVVTQAVAAQGGSRDDRWLSVLSLSHMLELSCGLLPSLRSGATFCFGRSLMPHEVVEAIRERRVNRMVVVPLVLRLLGPQLARRPEVAGQLDALFSGGAPLGPDLVDDYAEMGIPVYQGYGLTELAPTVSMNTAGHNRPRSVGRPIAGTELRIVEGEILVRSPGLMAGYWLDDELTRTVIDEDGWFHTGDLGEVDADGYLYVTGRAKNLIVLDSGQKVHPEEVEAVLAPSGLFAEVCVVAVAAAPAHLASSEQVGVVVVPAADVVARHGGGAGLHDELVAEVDRRARVLSGYKRPTVVEVWTQELPKTAKRSVRRADVTRLVRERKERSR